MCKGYGSHSVCSCCTNHKHALGKNIKELVPQRPYRGMSLCINVALGPLGHFTPSGFGVIKCHTSLALVLLHWTHIVSLFYTPHTCTHIHTHCVKCYVVSPAYLPLHCRNIVRNKILLALCNNTRQKILWIKLTRERRGRKR